MASARGASASAARRQGFPWRRQTWKVTSNRYVNETKNRTLTTPRQRPEDAKDAAVGPVLLSDFPTFTCLPAVLGVLGVLAVDAVGPFRLRERLPFAVHAVAMRSIVALQVGAEARKEKSVCPPKPPNAAEFTYHQDTKNVNARRRRAQETCRGRFAVPLGALGALVVKPLGGLCGP